MYNVTAIKTAVNMHLTLTLAISASKKATSLLVLVRLSLGFHSSI